MPPRAQSAHKSSTGAVAASAPATVSSSSPPVSSSSRSTPPGQVRVVIRCRPLHPELERDHTQTRLTIKDDVITVSDSSGTVDSNKAAGGGGISSNGNNSSSARQFKFDRVLDSSATQAAAFSEVAPLVDHVLSGFHATVFAYGQTGSGKTFTMEGLDYKTVNFSRKGKGGGVDRSAIPDLDTPPEQHGVTLRTIQLLFDKAHERQGRRNPASAGPSRKDDDGDTEANEDGGVLDPDEEAAAQDGDVQYRFKCSFYQIYNEKVTDLLNVSRSKARSEADGGLRLRWQPGDTFAVENLFYYECDSAEKMREAFFRGVKEKEVSGHLMNHQSSRSHCVFTIHVVCTKLSTGEVRSKSEFSIVDLAGSERLGALAANPSARLVKESIDINTSLLALGKVIMALSGGSTATPAQQRKPGGVGGSRRAHPVSTAHIPYRDSKLTKLLKHALGGNSITVMFACISPSDAYIEESVSTLLYAGRARNIQNVPLKNQDPTVALVKQLRAEIAQLKKELNYYRALATESIELREQAAREVRASSAAPLQIENDGRGGTNGSSADPKAEPTSEGSSGGGNGTSPSMNSGEPKSSSAKPTPSNSSNAHTEELAESLLSACEMLKQVMNVNGQLRSAYDTIRAAKEEGDRREVQLNAENIALRERIQVLESIVLNDGFEQGVTAAAAAAAAAEADRGGEAAHRKDREGDEEEMEVIEVEELEEVGGTDEADGSTGFSPTVPSAGRHPSREDLHKMHDRGGADGKSRSGTAEASVAPSNPSSAAVKKEPTPKVSRQDVGTEEEEDGEVVAKSSEIVVDEATGRRVLRKRRIVRRKKKGNSPPAGPYASGSGSHKQKQLKPSYAANHHSKKLARRLEEYEMKYRGAGANGGKGTTYEDYYGRAEMESGVSFSSQKANDTIKEMERTLRKLPRSVVADFIPASLRSSKRFGTLAFGGARADAEPFEARRQTRESKKAELLRKQQELYGLINRDIQDKNFGPIDPSIPPPPPHSPLDVVSADSGARPMIGYSSGQELAGPKLEPGRAETYETPLSSSSRRAASDNDELRRHSPIPSAPSRGGTGSSVSSAPLPASSNSNRSQRAASQLVTPRPPQPPSQPVKLTTLDKRGNSSSGPNVSVPDYSRLARGSSLPVTTVVESSDRLGLARSYDGSGAPKTRPSGEDSRRAGADARSSAPLTASYSGPQLQPAFRGGGGGGGGAAPPSSGVGIFTSHAWLSSFGGGSGVGPSFSSSPLQQQQPQHRYLVADPGDATSGSRTGAARAMTKPPTGHVSTAAQQKGVSREETARLNDEFERLVKRVQSTTPGNGTRQ